MESLVTELVWLVTNYQAWVVGVLLFGDPHIWYRRYSFFEILALCKDAGTVLCGNWSLEWSVVGFPWGPWTMGRNPLRPL